MDRNAVYEMNINSGAFKAMREDFDKVLTRTLKNILSKEGDCAELTVKLKIGLEKAKAPNFAPYGDPERDIVKPKFEHKVSSVMNIKDEESGSFKGDYELVWDEELQDFVVRPVDNGQMDLFTRRDGDGNIIYQDADYVEVGEPAGELPPAPLLLGSPDDTEEGDVDDGEEDDSVPNEEGFGEDVANDLDYPEPEEE